MNQASSSTAKFSASLKTIAANIGIMLAVNVAIKAAAKLWDTLNITVEEQEQKINELKSSYEGLKSEYDELSQKQDVTDAEKRRLEYLERRLELDERILKAEQAQLFKEKTGNKFTDLFDKDNLQTQYLGEMNIRNSDGYAGQKFKYNNRTDDISKVREQISEWKDLQATVEEGSKAWDEYQKRIDNAQNKETKYIDQLSEQENQLTINLGKYADNIEFLQSQLDSGDLTEDQTATAKEQLAEWQKMYDQVELMITEIQKLNGTYEETKEVIEDVVDESEKLTEEAVPQWDYSTTITQLDDIKEKLDVLDKSFAKLYDKDGSIGFEDISSINEAFSEVDGIEDYIKEIQEAGQDTEKVADAFSRLTAAYLDHTGILNNVTYENKELIASMLEEMGIANAEDIVLAALGQTTEVVAIQKQFLTEKGYELANATVEEINQFIKEVSASEEVKRALAQLTLEKMDFNNNPITTSADIDNLIALANTAGASAEALVRLNEIKKAPNSARAKSILENMDWGFTKLNAADFKVSTSSSKYKPQYKGGSSTRSSIKSAQKEASKAAEEAKNEFEELVDFFEQRVKVLDNALSFLKTNLDNVTGTFAKNKLVDAELGITEEKFKNYSDALNMYTQKANEALAKLPADIAAKVKDGAVDLTTFIGDGNEEVVEAVKDYENWADKVADCKQELAELKTAIRELELEKFNNIVEDFTNQFDIREDGKDLISKQISLLEEAGQLIGDSFFTTQIDQSKKQLELLEAEKAQLVNQMSSAIGSGRVN